MSPQIEYRITHQLPWPVKRNIPAAIALKHLDAASRQRIRRNEHMSSFGIAPKSNDGRMFQQQQDVADPSSFAQFDQLSLQPKPFNVAEHPELDNRNHSYQTL